MRLTITPLTYSLFGVFCKSLGVHDNDQDLGIDKMTTIKISPEQNPRLYEPPNCNLNLCDSLQVQEFLVSRSRIVLTVQLCYSLCTSPAQPILHMFQYDLTKCSHGRFNISAPPTLGCGSVNHQLNEVVATLTQK